MIRAILLIISGIVCLFTGFAAWLVFTPWGAKSVVRELARRTLGARTVSWEKLEGSLVGGIQVDQLEVRVIPFLPEASFLRVQSLSIRISRFSLDGVDIRVVNARLFQLQEEPIFLNGQLRGWEVSGNAFTRSLELGNVRDVLVQFFEIPPFKGTLRDIDLFVSGRVDRPDVRGHFFVEKILQNDFLLQEVNARADLHFTRGSPRWETRGKLFLDSGNLKSSVALIELKPSILTFTGRPSRPELDIHATSKIARTLINISVKGARQAPEVVLSSEPSYPKQQLLLMLATGKRWSGIVEGASEKSRMSPVLASNFVDYLLFGGDRVKIIRAIGLSDISFNADDKKQGVTFSKDVTDRLGIGYGVEVGTTAQRQRDLTQRVEGEYQLTDKVILGAQKEMRFSREGSTAAGQNNTPMASGDVNEPSRISSRDIPDDRVFLKYRLSF
ncbi:MAG: translocation/assembly module TamB domain-containing protein [Candidatus Omnitrophica bacterium]|nr:translocation/assembly module TamB domain-containing protein [Candidatus Omnitrophota bacterium]